MREQTTLSRDESGIGIRPEALKRLTADVRYLCILAAILQITAPDFGLGLFHGRDRKTQWLGFVLGLTTAVGTIIFQDQTLLF
jgi:hypothetical protein